MGKSKPFVAHDLTFVPRISETSKRIALRRASRLDTKGIPHFMQSTISKRLTLEPITSLPLTDHKSIGKIITVKTGSDQSLTSSRRLLSDRRPIGTVGSGVNETESCKSSDTVLDSHYLEGAKRLRPLHAMSKSVYAPPRSLQLDENVFTFHPKVSLASVRIAESLGTDFMSRQQQHIERQKKFFEQSSQPVNISVHLNPHQKPPRNAKELDDLTNNALNKESDINSRSPLSGASGAWSKGLGAIAESSESVASGEIEDKTQEAYMDDSMVAGTKSSTGLQALLNGPYAASAAHMVIKKKKQQNWLYEPVPPSSDPIMSGYDGENELVESLTRSKTVPALGRHKANRKIFTFNDGERLRLCKDTVEKAIKYHKIFTIQGGYASIRHSLRRRGWVEKFFKIQPPTKPSPKQKLHKNSDDDDEGNDDDDTDDDGTDDDADNDQPKIPPWEEDDGVYGIMSRMVRSVSPSLFWVLKRDVIDYRFLGKDQMVNHYCKAGSFTTKVGLCVNMRNVPWFDNINPNQFFPRCYRLSHDEDKAAFIDDFRQTTCMNILKIVARQQMIGPLYFYNDDEEGEGSTMESDELDVTMKDKSGDSSRQTCTNPDCKQSQPSSNSGSKCLCLQQDKITSGAESGDSCGIKTGEESRTQTPESPFKSQKIVKPPLTKRKKRVNVPARILDIAMQQCEIFLSERNHDDIDKEDEKELSDVEWEELIHWYYQLAHEDGRVCTLSPSTQGELESLVNQLRTRCPQFEMDGDKNVWIVKPGAKSRGRGILCYNRLDEMLKLVSSNIVKKEGKFVVQKYIEKPLLIYNTKFDIRQWFLVTDWNPLTLWFYQDSYLRFCSQQFTLDDFDQAIHLSNNAIQKNYKNGPRSRLLPEENMWTHEEFKEYLRKVKKQPHAWEEVIYPSMKRAIICSLLCTQDLIEYRKSSFELYGADFMLTEDLQPWLIEINSSPSMEASTSVTAKLCHNVLDDTIKVVVDRKNDKNCDVGAFELAFKQPLVTVPPYIGISLSVEGQGVRKPGNTSLRRSFNENSNVNESTVTQRTPLRLSHSEKVDNLGTKRTLSGQVSAVTTGAHLNNHKKDSESLENSPGTSTLKFSYGGYVESNPSLVQIDGKNGGTLRIKSQSSENQTENKKIKSERVGEIVTKQSSDGKAPSTHLFPRSHSVYLQQTPLLYDVGNKRILSRTSVSNNYVIPASQSGGGYVRPLAVNNVESTDLKSFKPVKGRLSSLADTAWSRTCMECGNGMSLRLDNSNPLCRCQQDSLVVAPMCNESRQGGYGLTGSSPCALPVRPGARARICSISRSLIANYQTKRVLHCAPSTGAVLPAPAVVAPPPPGGGSNLAVGSGQSALLKNTDCETTPYKWPSPFPGYLKSRYMMGRGDLSKGPDEGRETMIIKRTPISVLIQGHTR